MKGRIFLLALSVIAMVMASCTNDLVIDENPGTAIKFAVSASKPSRATTTLANLTGFKVLALTEGKLLFEKAEVEKKENKWVFTANTQFWPEANVDFYAITPSSIEYSKAVTTTLGTFPGVVYNCYGNCDMLYARALNQSKKTNPTVQFAFKHALSKVSFAAKNTNGNFVVLISQIRVVGLKDQGNFILGNATTDPQWSDLDKSLVIRDLVAYNYTGSADPETRLTAKTVDKRSGTVELDDDNFFIIPQTLNPWSKTNTDGAYIGVKCAVLDIRSGKLLWPKDYVKDNLDTYLKELIIPMPNPTNSTNGLEMGKSYKYTLVFGDGFGIDPDTQEPIATAIKVDVTEVNGFTSGDDTEVKHE